MDFTPEGRICSFCGVVGSKRTNFFGGFGAMICPRCVEDFYDFMHTEAAKYGSRRPPWELMSDAELVGALPDITASADQANRFVADWIGLIRERGISWTQIGAALGVSRQAVWQRFGKMTSGDDTGRANTH